MTKDEPGAQAPEAAPAAQPATVQMRSPAAVGGGDLTEELLSSDWWTDAMVQAAGIPIVDVPFVSVGGGIGSFVTVDYLRIANVAPDRMRVLSNIEFPWKTYEYLTRVSQIPRGERIRSDSASRPDNIWGFPSYALAEAVRDKSLKPLWQVLIEPIWADYYTPKAGQVFAGLERETRRIGFPEMLVRGQVRMVRRRQGAGYFTILTPPPGTEPTRRVAYRSEFVHVAIGYPGLRFLPELQAFRTEHQDFHHVVSAYEDHEHVYELARTKHIVVMLRGGGIVAAAEHDDNMLRPRQLVHMLVIFIGADHVMEVLMLRAERLQLRKESQAWIADRDVNELGPVGNPPRRLRSGRRGEYREIASALAAAHHPDLAGHQHLRKTDPPGLALKPGKHLARLGRVVVGPDRLYQNLPERFQAFVTDGLGERIGREAPDVVGPGCRVRPDPLTARNLRYAGEVLVGLPGELNVRQHPHAVGRHV